MDEDPIVFYIVVNKDLNMTPGKLAGQAGHCVQKMMHRYMACKGAIDNTLLTVDKKVAQEFLDSCYNWFKDGKSTKIILGASQNDFDRVKKEVLDIFVVTDLGLTELTPNTDTVIGIGPIKKSQIPKFVKRLRLY